MNAPGATAAKGLWRWWATPPRSGMRRLINPVAYRHPRVLAALHTAGGTVAATAGIVCLSYAAYGWAAFFLLLGTGNLAGGYWYLTIARGFALSSTRRS